LRKLIKKAPKRASLDQVHDLRTHTRRLEAAVEALGLHSKRNERRLLRSLARVRKRAGKVRDMDVLTGYASKIHADTDQPCLVQLLEYLGSARCRHAKKLSQVMRGERPALLPRFKRTSAKLEKLIPKGNPGSRNDSSPAQTTLPAEVMATALRLSKDLQNPPTLNRTNLHPYRLEVKELRNTLRMAERAGNQAFLDALGQVKDAIGEWHDWEELIAVATDQLDHEPNCPLLRELKSTSARKYEQALSLANKMRRDFLGTNRSNKEDRSPNNHGLPKPIIEAAQAIAS
jgi:CHAD domain-containing protein